MNQKKNVLVVFGGASPEYEVSCVSASGIIEHIDREKFDLVKLGITREGEWYYTEASMEEVKDGYRWIESETNKKAAMSFESRNPVLLVFEKDGTVSKINLDVAFPIVHGENGEDGTLQGLFEIAGLPYVGAGVCSSSCSMDKVITRLFADHANVLQPRCYIMEPVELHKKAKDVLIREIELCVGKKYPVIIKPSMTGSSIGISKASNAEELYEGIVFASQYRGKVMIEEYIFGREVKVAVLQKGEEVLTGDICEIIIQDGCFNDYNLKYKGMGTHKRIPADLEEHITAETKESAVKIFNEINCKDYARVDFFITEEGKIYFNEINTIPGFSKGSIYPLMIDKIGISYTELISILIENNL